MLIDACPVPTPADAERLLADLWQLTAGRGLGLYLFGFGLGEHVMLGVSSAHAGVEETAAVNLVPTDRRLSVESRTFGWQRSDPLRATYLALANAPPSTIAAVALSLRALPDLGFALSLGVIGGHPVDLDEYVAPTTVSRLQGALRPLRSAGSILRVEFGEYAEVRIEGDVLDRTSPLRSVVEFEDRSVRIDEDGRPVVRARRRIRLSLVLDPEVTRVLDHRLEYA